MSLRSTPSRLIPLALAAAIASACSASVTTSRDGDVGEGADLAFGGVRDGGSGASDLAAAAADLGTGPTLGCKGALECANNCLAESMDEPSRRACTDACSARSRPLGWSLLRDLYVCLETECPSARFGDACFDRRSAACEDCFRAAQGGGACAKALSLCIADVP